MTRLERAWCESWIQPHHTRAAALRKGRAAFAAHPAGLLILPAFLRPDVARRASRFLADEAQYTRVHALYSQDDDVSAAAWMAASASDRLYRYSVVTRPAARHRLSPNIAAYLRLMHTLEDARTTEFFSAMTGVPLGPLHASVHAMRRGDFLAAHTDDKERRRLAYILYLTPGWREDAGGVLHLSSQGGAWRIVPAFNTLVIFDVLHGTEHYVSRIRRLCHGQARITIGGWVARGSSGRMTTSEMEAT